MRNFFTELEQLQRELEDMALLVKSSIERSVRCLTERNPDLADQVVRDETIVNRSEIAIDDFATTLVSRNQPVASDMRLLIAALKMNTDLERMGDLAVSIARRALQLVTGPHLDVPIEQMSQLVQSMVEKAILSFTSRDVEMARGIMASDDQVDSMRNLIYDDLIDRMEKDPKLIRTAMLYMFIARNLERIADHATNIAEDVIFVVKGIDVRHHNEPDSIQG